MRKEVEKLLIEVAEAIEGSYMTKRTAMLSTTVVVKNTI
jgi:hypothetical protein